MGYDSQPPSRRRHSLGGTCATSTLCTETFPSTHIPLTFLSTVTFVLFVLMCYLSTPHTLQRLSIYHPSTLAHLRGADVDPDTSSIFVSRHQFLGRLDQSGYTEHRSSSHEQVLGSAPGKPKVGIIHPDIKLVESAETERETGGYLWFKAEYSIEVPLCDLEGDLENSGEVRTCTQDTGTEVRIPASESVRVSFCNVKKHVKSGEGSEQYGINNRGGEDVWEDNKTWDYVFPPTGPRDSDATGDWLWNVEERPLKRWITVNTPGESHDTSLRTHMISPINAPTGGNAGTKPQWQFLLTIAGVRISADAQEVLEEEIFVDHPVEVPVTEVESQKSSSSISGSFTEVKNVKVKMWRWKGTFGGCPGESKRGQVVLMQSGDRN